MQIDIASLLVSTGAIVALMGMWMLAASFARGERNAAEMRIWASSCLIFGAAYLLFALRGSIPLFWSLVVGNLLFGIAHSGFAWAVARLFGRRFPFAVVLGAILLCIGALFILEILLGTDSWRVPILAALTFVPWTVGAVQCSQQWLRDPTPHKLAMSLAFAVMILVSLWRVAWAAARGDFGYQGLPTGPGYLLGTHVLMISPVLLTLGFFLLCAEQTRAFIERIADSDPLTGILNRRSVIRHASQCMASARRHGQPCSCVTIDIDRLKIINDRHGHAAGDLVLRQAVAVIEGLKRAEDSFGRLSGDEFVVFMPHADLAGAAVLAERFQDAIHRHEVAHGSQVLRITASFGVAELRDTDASPTDLLARADRAMYRAKAAGGDTVRSVDDDDDGNRAATSTRGRAPG